MIRDFERMRRNAGLLAMLVVLAAFLGTVGNGVARAGDDDGIQGYSMRLKNKSFTTDPGGSNGSGFVVGEIPIAGSKPTEAKLVGAGIASPEHYGLPFWVRYWTWFVLLSR